MKKQVGGPSLVFLHLGAPRVGSLGHKGGADTAQCLQYLPQSLYPERKLRGMWAGKKERAAAQQPETEKQRREAVQGQGLPCRRHARGTSSPAPGAGTCASASQTCHCN